MSLHKIYNFVGYNNLGLILEQERKHWLLKPDKKLNLQNSETGSIFQGRLDNLGNEIVVETNKTDAYTGTDLFKFTNDIFNDVLEPLASALPYNNALNGLMYECIIASKVAYEENNTTSYKNYKIRFKNCEEVIIPFGDSLDTSNVYSGKWIKTTTNPVMVLPNSSNSYTIEIPLQFESNVTGCIFYYPLEENMQPLSLTNDSSGTYTTEAVTDHTFIGYPVYWFTSDNTNVGPTISIPDNVTNNKTIFYIANPGNVSKYKAEIFCDVDGNNDATPDGSTSDWKITCETLLDDFTGTTADTQIPLDMLSIKLEQISTGIEYSIPFVSDNNDILTLAGINNWTRSGNKAEAIMSNYDTNCYEVQHDDPLIPAFSLHLDETVSFMHNTTDVGYAGLHVSSEEYSETTERYPYDLDKWDGLPTWLNDNDEGCPQHTAMYAIHNTPNFNPNDPTTRQTTAILLDPGKPKTSDDPDYSNDERGRAYLISNDDAEYHNNAVYEYAKPPRTIARICDIPTTLTQLSNISGLAPTTVVDKRYVHTDACYTTEEKDRLYNVLNSKWVRPIHVDEEGRPITDRSTSDNDYIFNSEADLKAVDLTAAVNDLCKYENLNPIVNPDNVVVNTITSVGSDYEEHDTGVVIIGGSSISYSVDTVDENGGVTAVSIQSNVGAISLSNFDMVDTTTGITSIYGTSPTTGSGTGLKFTMRITNYDDIRTKRGAVYNDLFALVKLSSGLWLYQYRDNKWNKQTIVSEAETSSIITSYGGLSTTDSYMMALVSSYRSLPVTMRYDHQAHTSIKVLSTPSFINVIDETYLPYGTNTVGSTVDFNKIVCLGIMHGKALQKTDEYVMSYLRTNNILRYDCYVLWKWDTSDMHDNITNFTYGIVYRSFNNFQSTDTTTFLPGNNLNYSNYVHTNEQTTIVWNVEGAGPLMWIYDPNSNIREEYDIDTITKDISIKRSNRSWDNIDMYNDTTFKIADDDGKLLYNIFTNNPTQVTNFTPLPTDPIYQQPTFEKIGSIGDPISSIKQPVGVWRLVYPRVNSYKLSNSSNGLSFDAIKMDIIRGDDLGVIGDIRNQNDDVVNKKILVIDRQTKGSALKVYNSQTNTWDKV